MTEVNGLRLAYRGLVTGLAAAYVWAAIAMIVGGLLWGDPLAPLRPLAMAVSPLIAASSELTFVVALAGVQAAGGLVGMVFAYFFARFFTARVTVAIAAPAYALLAWALVAAGLVGFGAPSEFGTSLAPLLASVGYGAMLGIGVPTRPEVERRAGDRQITDYSGSPST